MQSITKIILAVAVVALAVVIALIVLVNRDAQTIPDETKEPAQAVETAAPAQIEQTQAPEEIADDAPVAPDAAPSGENADSDELYEGALAGLSEEEIGALALAEEGASVESAGEEGVD